MRGHAHRALSRSAPRPLFDPAPCACMRGDGTQVRDRSIHYRLTGSWSSRLVAIVNAEPAEVAVPPDAGP